MFQQIVMTPMLYHAVYITVGTWLKVPMLYIRKTQDKSQHRHCVEINTSQLKVRLKE